MNEQYDYILVGSGAGGGAATYRLAQAGKRVLVLEKGGALPKDGSTLDVDKVIRRGAFKSRETWLDKEGARFAPEEYFNLGGKTKWYGAALARFAPEELEADPQHQCLGWPIGYQDLVPYYEEAERLLQVRTFDPEPGLAAMVARLARRGGWRSEPLPLALAADILDHPEEARHFDAFASVRGLKYEAENCFLAPVTGLPNLQIRTGTPVAALVGAEERPGRIDGVRTESGETIRAGTVLLAAGALHSPRLLQSYLEAIGLAATLPAAANVGRNYKQHLLTAVVAFTTRYQRDLLRKTLLLLSERVPHSSIQPLGFDGELIGALMPGLLPRALTTTVGNFAYGFFLQTEDGSDPANRVEAGRAGKPPRLDYDPERIRPSRDEHRRLVRGFVGALWRSGYAAFSKRIPLAGTAHALGSLVAGSDPTTSVVDAAGRVHGMENLYVVDGSILPRSSRVNPSLTIYAWALRVADRLVRQQENRSNVEQELAETQDAATA
jgi:choline dehydrogenase-like flavoprotein